MKEGSCAAEHRRLGRLDGVAHVEEKHKGAHQEANRIYDDGSNSHGRCFHMGCFEALNGYLVASA